MSDYEHGSFGENKSSVVLWSRERQKARTAMGPWPHPYFSGPHSSAPALRKAAGGVWSEGSAARLDDWTRVTHNFGSLTPTLFICPRPSFLTLGHWLGWGTI